MIRWLRYFSYRALRNVREEWSLNLRVVTGFALMLVVGGLFFLLGANLRALVERWGEQLQVTAYLKKGLPEEQGQKIAHMIGALPEVEAATFVSETLALSRFRKDLAGMAGVLDGLDENPLPASIEVRVPARLRASEKVAEIARQIAALSGVSEVQFGQEWVERYRVVLEVLSLVGLAVGCVLLFVGWSSISNLIQLTVYARKDEIEILKLVGATDRFVRAPLLLEGLLQGLAASLLALTLLALVFRLTLGSLASALGGFLGSVELVFFSGPQILLLIAGSMALSLAASLMATRQHLDV